MFEVSHDHTNMKASTNLTRLVIILMLLWDLFDFSQNNFKLYIFIFSSIYEIVQEGYFGIQ